MKKNFYQNIHTLIDNSDTNEALERLHEWANLNNNSSLITSLALCNKNLKMAEFYEQKAEECRVYAENLKTSSVEYRNQVNNMLKNIINETQDIRDKILFLAANPVDTPMLKLEEEFAYFYTSLQNKSKLFCPIVVWAIKAKELQDKIRGYSPRIVHFSGHGISKNVELGDSSRAIGYKNPLINTGGIFVEDLQKKKKLLGNFELAEMFGIIKRKCEELEIVFFNACSTEELAMLVSKHNLYVVGMSKPVLDSSAISFSSSFYNYIANGESIEDSFVSARLDTTFEDVDFRDIPNLYFEGKKII
jgi:hypothetical protein